MTPAASPRWSVLRQDAVAGLINAVVSVPDGLASAALAGVNPVFGLYTSIAAPIGGSLLASAQLMQISTTSAAALAAGQAVAAYPAPQRAEAMFLLAVLTGIGLLAFGLLRLGRLVRFVSHAVMTGFLTGVAVVLVLDQPAPLLGASPTGANELTQLVTLLSSGDEFDPPTLAMGVLALALAAGLARTRVATFSSLARAVPSLCGGRRLAERSLVSDVSVSRADSMPSLPTSRCSRPRSPRPRSRSRGHRRQGAGVSERGDRTAAGESSRDMLARAWRTSRRGSSAASRRRLGGQTALNVSSAPAAAGPACSRRVVLPSCCSCRRSSARCPAVLAALMILAGLSALDLREARSIWATGGAARWSILATFVATLVFSVPVAVAVGIGLSVVLALASAASDVRVYEVVRLPDGRFAQAEPPARLPSDDVTVLEVVGSLFFAGARTLEESLPSPAGSRRPAVVLRLRGRTRAGATLIEVLDASPTTSRRVGGRLYLSGVDVASTHFGGAGKLALPRVHLVPARRLGAPLRGHRAGRFAWLGSAAEDRPDDRPTD